MKRHPILELRDVTDEIYEASGLELRDLSRQRLWLFDLEATGLDTRRERVTQIAGMPLENGRLVEEEVFTELVHPGEGVAIPKVVEELTGLTLERLRGAPSFPRAWARHLRAAQGCALWIGQSVFEFDVPLLLAELGRHGLPPELPPILDTVVMATALLGPPEHRWSTTSLVQRFGVDVEGLRRHDALDDVKILGRILLPMLELVRSERGDALVIPRDRPLPVRRHPPVKDDPA